MDRKNRIGYWIIGALVFVILLQFWLFAETGRWAW